MKQVTPSLPDKARVEPTSDVHSRNTDNNGPSELVRPGEDDRSRVRRELEQVLEGSFDSAERPAVVAFDFLPSSRQCFGSL